MLLNDMKKHNVLWKEPGTTEYRGYYSIYIKFEKSKTLSFRDTWLSDDFEEEQGRQQQDGENGSL